MASRMAGRSVTWIRWLNGEAMAQECVAHQVVSSMEPETKGSPRCSSACHAASVKGASA